MHAIYLLLNLCFNINIKFELLVIILHSVGYISIVLPILLFNIYLLICRGK